MTSKASFPAEFIMTEHGEQRLRERVKVSPRKMENLCRKAWYGKSVSTPKLLIRANRGEYFYTGQDDHFFRELMGYVFIFCYGCQRPKGLPPQKKLITVI